MVMILLAVVIALLLIVLAVQWVQLKRGVVLDLSPVGTMFSALEKAQDRTERAVHEEIAKNRQEAAANDRNDREEIGGTLRSLGEALNTQLARLIDSNDQKLQSMRETVEGRLTTLQADNGAKIDQVRQETGAAVQKVREEVAAALTLFSQNISKSMETLGGSQRAQLSNVSELLAKLTESNEKKLETVRSVVDERLTHIQNDGGKKLDQMRVESATSSKQMREETGLSLKEFRELLSGQISVLTDANEKRMDALKLTFEEKMKALQEDNSKSLEQMRQTVDEKLQGTLEKRLGESFKLVSERLEQVHKGLGEMQTLATGVGDLKRVLTNVKTRGTWGEVQLGALLEQVLSPEQYDVNVATKGGAERVEYAIKLPNRGGDENNVLYLPIDAKFPVEDYQRLIDAQDRADPEAAEAAGKQLEARIKQCASDICGKYINPPNTTDFAILFLPTEGLFAEVLRRTGLPEMIQRDCRVVIAGPTTLWSILNSFQMGFKTLTIQKRSSEVWNVLAEVKEEFRKYGDVLGKVQKKLHEASDTIDKEVAVRTRAIQKKLRGVEVHSAPQEVAPILALGGINGDIELGDDAN